MVLAFPHFITDTCRIYDAVNCLKNIAISNLPFLNTKPICHVKHVAMVPGMVGGYPLFPYARCAGIVALIFCLSRTEREKTINVFE